jgi:hypothetical protein
MPKFFGGISALLKKHAILLQLSAICLNKLMFIQNDDENSSPKMFDSPQNSGASTCCGLFIISCQNLCRSKTKPPCFDLLFACIANNMAMSSS